MKTDTRGERFSELEKHFVYEANKVDGTSDSILLHVAKMSHSINCWSQ